MALLSKETGEVFHCNNTGWWWLRSVCQEHGWTPSGTVIEGDPTWDGDYTTNDGQVVTAEDATAMADAIGRIPLLRLSDKEYVYFCEFARFCRIGPFELW